MTEKRSALGRRLVLLGPLGVAAVAGVAFFAMLRGMEEGKFNPRGVPTPLLGKKVPDFGLPGQGGATGFSGADLSSLGHPVLVNFFASWCAPCQEEAPVLMQLKQLGVPMWGVAYKDAESATATFLTRHGDPYERIGRDVAGRVAIDWGLTGVPETYLVDAHGIVRWHIAEPLQPDVVSKELLPLLKRIA